MNYSNNDNLLIQSYFTVAFLSELTNTNFLESDYYREAVFEDEFVHENLPKIGIDNQGTLLIFLYTFLVVPKQLLEERFTKEFGKLNPKIDKLKASATSSYASDKKKIDYVRHLRNAVAHARVDFSTDGVVTFRDRHHNGSECEIVIPLQNVGNFITELQQVFVAYIESVKGGFRA